MRRNFCAARREPMDKYVKVLGSYLPRTCTIETIQDNVLNIVLQAGYRPYYLSGGSVRVEVRRPGFETQIYWHKDCGGSTKWIVVWASENPTRVRWRNKMRWHYFYAKAGDVIWINNQLCEHCPPYEMGTRWFARVVSQV